MTRVYIVRHCEAQGNKDGRFQGKIDSGISENGIAQLKLLEEKFKNIHLDAIYSSPLKRAVFTADAVNKYHGLEIRLNNELREIDGGEFEGNKWKDLPALFPESTKLWVNEPALFYTHTGESMKDVYNRVTSALKSIVVAQQDRTVAIVSHGCSIRNMICYAKYKSIEKLNSIDWCDNTGISLVEFDSDFNPKLIFENNVDHLSENLLEFSKKFI